MSKEGKRARAERRLKERGMEKLMRDRERLAQSEPGGSPDNPISVPTPAVLEVRAENTPCPLCDGALELLEHTAERRGELALRALRCKCKQCRIERTLWFTLETPALN